MDVFERLIELRARREPAAMVTVIQTSGSTPRKPGARMLVTNEGLIWGTIGGGKVEHVLRQVAARVIKTQTPETVHTKLTAELAMCCGGQMTFFVEPIVSNPALIVFGCGHIGSALVYAAAPLGFDIIAVDDLPEHIESSRFPQATRIVDSYETDALRSLPYGEDTFIVIATRDHALDQRLLEFCAKESWRYLGVIGSPRKSIVQKERLLAKGFSREQIERVHCPIGLDIGALTPEEIGVSICAELIQIRRGGPRFSAR